jgi:hypothetical protein
MSGLGIHSGFDKSLGQDLKMGPFVSVVSQQSSGGEENCAPLRPVIIAALHDIKERLETHSITTFFSGTEDAFEVNEPTLQLFCRKNATIILSDSNGNRLVLQKVPFVRVVPKEGAADDIGTEVRINATVVPAGGAVPLEPTTYGDILIPDRFLDTAASSTL